MRKARIRNLTFISLRKIARSANSAISLSRPDHPFSRENSLRIAGWSGTSFLPGFLCDIFQSTIANNPVLSLFSQAMGADDAVIGRAAAVSPLGAVIIITAAGCTTGWDSFEAGAVTAAFIIQGCGVGI